MRKHGGYYIITSYNPDSGESAFNPVVCKELETVARIIREQSVIIADENGDEPDPSELYNRVMEAMEEENVEELSPTNDNNVWEYESDVDNTTWTITCVVMQ